MKKLKLFTFCLVASTSYAENLPASVSQLIPKNWEVISFAKGDLNQDQHEDVVILLQPKNHKLSNPKLFIYFKENQTYKLKLSKPFDSWVYGDEEKCIGNTFDESSLEINNQVLSIHFNDEPVCHNTYSINYTYKFKYDQHLFKLIGLDSFSGDKLSGNIKETSVNYLSNKTKIHHYNFFPDKKLKPTIAWKKLENKKSYNLENMLFNSDDYHLKFEEQYK